MVDFRNYLGSHVSGSTAEGVDCIGFLASQTETKINQFKLAVTVDENIFSFDVSMDDISVMEIEESLGDDK